MRPKERWLYLVLISIITISSLSQWYSHKRKVTTSLQQNLTNTWISHAQQRNELESEDWCLNPKLVLRETLTDSIDLKGITERRCIILYINPHACDICLDSIFLSYQKVFGRNSKLLNVITTTPDERSFSFDIANNILNYRRYFLIDRSLGIPLCELEMPFIFLLDIDYRAKLVFIPDRADTKSTRWYFELLKKRFFNN
jgi:hypothetical protein